MKFAKAWIIGAIVPVILTLLAVTRTMTYDAAISVVETILAVSPIPVIIANYRLKTGQSKLTMVTLTSGLLSIGTMFLLAGFVLTALATIMSGFLWGAVAAEAFLYASKTVHVREHPRNVRLDLPKPSTVKINADDDGLAVTVCDGCGLDE